MHSLPYDKESFTTQKWKSDEDHRYKIVDDLINSNLVDGKSRNQIIELLGEPCDYNEDGGYIEYIYKNDTLTRDSDFVYSIGTKPGIY